MGMTPREVAFLVMTFVLTTLINSNYAIVAAFFQVHATTTLGLAREDVARIFAAFALSQLLISPFSGAMASRFSRRRVLVCGVCGVSSATVLFGCATLRMPAGRTGGVQLTWPLFMQAGARPLRRQPDAAGARLHRTASAAGRWGGARYDVHLRRPERHLPDAQGRCARHGKRLRRTRLGTRPSTRWLAVCAGWLPAPVCCAWLLPVALPPRPPGVCATP